MLFENHPTQIQYFGAGAIAQSIRPHLVSMGTEFDPQKTHPHPPHTQAGTHAHKTKYYSSTLVMCRGRDRCLGLIDLWASLLGKFQVARDPASECMCVI